VQAHAAGHHTAGVLESMLSVSGGPHRGSCTAMAPRSHISANVAPPDTGQSASVNCKLAMRTACRMCEERDRWTGRERQVDRLSKTGGQAEQSLDIPARTAHAAACIVLPRIAVRNTHLCVTLSANDWKIAGLRAEMLCSFESCSIKCNEARQGDRRSHQRAPRSRCPLRTQGPSACAQHCTGECKGPRPLPCPCAQKAPKLMQHARTVAMVCASLQRNFESSRTRLSRPYVLVPLTQHVWSKHVSLPVTSMAVYHVTSLLPACLTRAIHLGAFFRSMAFSRLATIFFRHSSSTRG